MAKPPATTAARANAGGIAWPERKRSRELTLTVANAKNASRVGQPNNRPNGSTRKKGLKSGSRRHGPNPASATRAAISAGRTTSIFGRPLRSSSRTTAGSPADPVPSANACPAATGPVRPTRRPRAAPVRWSRSSLPMTVALSSLIRGRRRTGRQGCRLSFLGRRTRYRGVDARPPRSPRFARCPPSNAWCAEPHHVFGPDDLRPVRAEGQVGERGGVIRKRHRGDGLARRSLANRDGPTFGVPPGEPFAVGTELKPPFGRSRFAHQDWRSVGRQVPEFELTLATGLPAAGEGDPAAVRREPQCPEARHPAVDPSSLSRGAIHQDSLAPGNHREGSSGRVGEGRADSLDRDRRPAARRRVDLRPR